MSNVAYAKHPRLARFEAEDRSILELGDISDAEFDALVIPLVDAFESEIMADTSLDAAVLRLQYLDSILEHSEYNERLAGFMRRSIADLMRASNSIDPCPALAG